MDRGRRILGASLLASLGLHLLLIGNARFWWVAPARDIPFPIEAHLTGQPTTPSPPHRAPSTPPPGRKAGPPAPAPAAPAPPAAPAEPTEPETNPPPAAPPPVQEPQPSPAIEPAPPAPTPPPPTPPPPSPAPRSPAALRELPERLTLRYSVQSGEGGFTLGQAVYTWRVRDGRYSLVSVAEATGITALFMSGRIVQTSEGRVTPEGLLPELFWIARGDRRQAPVQFDWNRNRLLLPGGGVDLPARTQDLMSFPFHLAMTAQDRQDEWLLPVTNGRKLREYGFRAVGHETLGEARLDTLHLQGGRAGEGTLDVWLAPTRHWLPVRIRSLDQKGGTLVFSLEGVD